MARPSLSPDETRSSNIDMDSIEMFVFVIQMTCQLVKAVKADNR